MKAKLLKKLRKDCSWTFVQQDVGGVVVDKWMLLHGGFISEYYNSESLIKHVLQYNADYYDAFWDWPWDNIFHQYHTKVTERTFRKYKQR
jgi:hypothetical protein